MEDYNQPSPERLDILREIERHLGGSPVPLYLWAALMICDIERLKVIAEEAKNNQDSIIAIAPSVAKMIKIWTQRPKAGTESNRSTPQRTPTPLGVFTDSPQQSPSLTTPSVTTNPLQSSTSIVGEHSQTPNPLLLPLSSTVMGPPPKRAQGSPASDQPPAKRQKYTTSIYPPGTPTVLQPSKSIRYKAAKRDQGECIITKSDAAEVCHIYPFYLLGYDPGVFGSQNTLWSMLRVFWPEAKIITWENDLFPISRGAHGLETTANMITFRADIYKLWNTGHFALKPVSISTDLRTLVVEFYWQSRKEKDMPSDMYLTELPESTQGATNFNIKPANDFEQRDSALSESKPLKSGDKLTMTTIDPVNMPLPSIKILELQWFLTRIVGMAGAGEVGEDAEYYDYPSDPEGAGLEELHDETLSNPGLQDYISQSDVSSTQPTPARPTIPAMSLFPLLKQRDKEAETKIREGDEAD